MAGSVVEFEHCLRPPLEFVPGVSVLMLFLRRILDLRESFMLYKGKQIVYINCASNPRASLLIMAFYSAITCPHVEKASCSF